ncbi:MAG: hypothetical protein GY737_03170 [Desulfobacteraceae bacterium]|nr:hypothetical protein [Desulfobacteraceae bacterium]
MKNIVGIINYYNPSDVLNKNRKSILNSYKQVMSTNANYECFSSGCSAEPINSHEISKDLFLKPLACKNNKVLMFDKDFANNINQYKLKEIDIKSATCFPGFCYEHDVSIFSDIENKNFALNDDFVNKQSFRVLAKEIYIQKQQSFLYKEKLLNGNYSFIERIVLKRLIFLHNKKIRLYKKTLKKLENLINTNKSLYYIVYDLEPKGIAFSKMMYTHFRDRYIFRHNFHMFINIFNVDDETKCILSVFNDEASREIIKQYLIKQGVGNFSLNRFILQNKERLVFSKKYYDSLSYVDQLELKDDNNRIGNGFFPNLLE